MAMPSSYEIYQRAQQSREEMTEAITRSLPELSDVDIKIFKKLGVQLTCEAVYEHSYLSH